MSGTIISPLAALEPRLRWLLPANLYADAWLDPAPPALTRVFEHLRTLLHVLQDYTPRHLAEAPTRPGQVRYQWQEGILMFTDLAGFTTMMEQNVAYGREGAERLFQILNSYFAAMIEIVSKFGGSLLEFTGDAMLVQFPAGPRGCERAIYAGLRMQRAMEQFANIEMPRGLTALQMRVGLHKGRFLDANIGTPRRMEYILIGDTIQRTKRAEGSGTVGRVCLTEQIWSELAGGFELEQCDQEHCLIVDNLSDEQIGEYDLVKGRRRLGSPILLDRTTHGLLETIDESVHQIEQLACYLPAQVLKLIIENAARRRIPPSFFEPTVMFIALDGLSEAALHLADGQEPDLIESISRAFTLINAVVEAHGGLLKKVTYHPSGSEVLVYFGSSQVGGDEPLRGARAALAIRELFARFTPQVGGQAISGSCKIGLSRGPVFAAEIGEPHGRREYNLLGDPVNTAARLVAQAASNQILLSKNLASYLSGQLEPRPLGGMQLKGKAGLTGVYEL